MKSYDTLTLLAENRRLVRERGKLRRALDNVVYRDCVGAVMNRYKEDTDLREVVPGIEKLLP